MSKGIPHETILKIGFLNDSTNLEKSLDQYSDVFDIVSVRDDTFKVQTKNSNSLNNYKWALFQNSNFQNLFRNSNYYLNVSKSYFVI